MRSFKANACVYVQKDEGRLANNIHHTAYELEYPMRFVCFTFVIILVFIGREEDSFVAQKPQLHNPVVNTRVCGCCP